MSAGEVFAIVGATMLLGVALVIVIAPWIGYVVDKYWSWCDDVQRRRLP